jgi:hypothetical protein
MPEGGTVVLQEDDEGSEVTKRAGSTSREVSTKKQKKNKKQTCTREEEDDAMSFGDTEEDESGNLLDYEQIAELHYYGRDGCLISSTDLLEELIHEKILSPTNVWIGYYRLDGDRDSNELVMVPWQSIFADNLGIILLNYFENNHWRSDHLDHPVMKRAYTELGEVLKNPKLTNKMVSYYGKKEAPADGAVIALEEVVDAGVAGGVDEPTGGFDEDDPDEQEEQDPDGHDCPLKKPSQIKEFRYYLGQTLISRSDILNRRISEKKVRDTDVWVAFEANGEGGDLDLAPWQAILEDGAGNVLEEYFEETNWDPGHLKDLVMRKAYRAVKKCLRNKKLCAQLLDEFRKEQGM